MKQFLFICFLLIARSPILVFSQESNLVKNIGYNDMLTEYKDYIGKEFLYYKVFNYTTNDAPFPWKEDRVRSGKYKSSMSAFNEYHESLESLSGKTYKLEKYVVYDGTPGLVFKDTGGNQFFYTRLASVETEFVDLSYLNYFKSNLLSKEYLYLGQNNNISSSFPQYLQLCYINVKTKESITYLPMYSSWIVTDVRIEPMYWGTHSLTNDVNNSFCRVVAVIHNKKLGDYECFLSLMNFEGLGVVSESTLSVFLQANGAFVLKDPIMEEFASKKQLNHTETEMLKTIKEYE